MYKVTCSILCYNYGRYLTKAIEGCLLQQKGNYTLEVLVIDDGSTDNTSKVCDKYKNEIKYYKSKNEGFAASLSKAVIYATGEIIFFLDADDYFAANKIINFLPYFIEGALYVSDTSTYINEQGELLKGGSSGSTSTVAVVRKAVIPLLPVENEISFFTLYKIGKGAKLKESYTFYRIHKNSMTNRGEAGKWNIYLASITHNLSNKLLGLTENNSGQIWNVKKQVIKKAAFEFKSQGYYNELEAALELKQVLKSYKILIKMILWQLRSKKLLSIFHFKMVLRTILVKPSFPKRF